MKGYFLRPSLRSLAFAAVLGVLLWGAAGNCAASAGHIPAQVIQSHSGTINVGGREVVYNSKTDTFIVRGDAVLTQAHTVLKADEIWVMRKQHRARAVGHVHLTDPEGVVVAKSAKINLVTETVELQDGDVLAKNKTYHLRGKVIRKLVGQRYEVKDGFFTTCGCESEPPSWSISAGQMNVHMGQSGTAKDVSFDIMGVPVLKLPKIVFPANTSRHSGFLSPRFGESGMRGAEYLQPYYIDINKSSDASVALDVETSQRIGLMTEYRLTNGNDDYLWVDGAFYDESIRSNANRESDIVDNQIADPHIPVDRYDLIGMVRQHLTPNLTVYGDGMTVSDSLLLRELNLWTLSRGFGNSFNSMRNAVSHFGLIDTFNGGYAQLQGIWNQDLIQPQRYALQTLPSLLVSGFKPLLGGLAYASYDVQAVNYWRANGISGLRLDLNPRITVPWRISDYLFGHGTVGFDETLYDVSGHNIAIIPVGNQGLKYNNGLAQGLLGAGGFHHREVPYVNVMASTILQRVYDLHWESIDKIKHTIEPFISYAYVPMVNQNSLPLFDQYDRINARSLLTYGFTSHLYAKVPGVGAIPAANAGQPGAPFNLADSVFGPRAAHTYRGGDQVHELLLFSLMDAYDTTHAVAPDGSGMSDIQANMVLLPNKIATLGTQVNYDPRVRQQINYSSVYFDFQPPWQNNTSPLYMGKATTGSFLQLSYNYIGPHETVENALSNNASEFLALRIYYDLFDRLGVYFAPSYDLAASKLLSAEYGIRLKSPCNCWAVDFGVLDTVNPNDLQFQFQVTLGGLGSVGQMPFGRNPFQVMGINRPPGFFPGY